MTRQEFEMIAKVLREAKPDLKSGTVGEKRIWAKIVRGLETEIENRHPRFDRDRFREACGFPAE